MAGTLTLIVWVGLVLIGPPVLLFWLIRRRRRRAHAMRDQVAIAVLPTLVAATPGTPDDSSSPAATQQTGNPYSFPYGMPIIVYPLLAIALAKVQHNIWMAALLDLLLVALAAAFTRLAFNRPDFEKARAIDPTMNLATWRINWLLFFATPPAVLALFGAAHLWLVWAGR